MLFDFALVVPGADGAAAAPPFSRNPTHEEHNLQSTNARGTCGWDGAGSWQRERSCIRDTDRTVLHHVASSLAPRTLLPAHPYTYVSISRVVLILVRLQVPFKCGVGEDLFLLGNLSHWSGTQSTEGRALGRRPACPRMHGANPPPDRSCEPFLSDTHHTRKLLAR